MYTSFCDSDLFKKKMSQKSVDNKQNNITESKLMSNNKKLCVGK